MVHETLVKTRFCETDALGHISNISYFIYLEQARVEFFEALGCPMNMENWGFILAHASCDFLKQGYFNQHLKIQTQVSKIGNKSFRLQQEIIEAVSEEVLARSESVIIYFNYDKQQSETVPSDLVEKMNLYLMANEVKGAVL